MMQPSLQPQAGARVQQPAPRDSVPLLRVETGALDPAPTQAPLQATQIVQRADAAVERAIFRATDGLPDWSLPAAGGLLIFVGAALLARGVLARQAARAAIDPRVQAWAAVARVAPRRVRAEVHAPKPQDQSKSEQLRLGELTLRLLRQPLAK
jgi:hypothetical protein